MGTALPASPYSLLAPAYDDIIGRDFFERLRAAFERLVRRHRIAFASAADLGCGTGLFARYLSGSRRIPVFAVDRSPAMLRIAAANCRAAPVTLLRQDIRSLCLPRPVDLVTANFDTVNHLLGEGDLARVFRAVHRHLRPGGHFIFDFITSCAPRPGEVLHRAASADGMRDVVQRIRWRPDSRMLLYEIVFRDARRPRARLERHRELTFDPEFVAGRLMEAGFVLREVLDATTLAPATACPSRMIVIAARP